MMEKHDKSPDELTPDQLDHDGLVSAMGTALRAVSIRLIDCVGIREAQSALFAEALSVAQGNMTHGEIAILLRGMAARIDSGELESTSH